MSVSMAINLVYVAHRIILIYSYVKQINLELTNIIFFFVLNFIFFETFMSDYFKTETMSQFSKTANNICIQEI